MAVFAIIPTDAATKSTLDQRINSLIPKEDVLKLPLGQWFIAYKGTSKDLSNALGITKGEDTSGIVIAVASYWGRATNDIWEWLEAKLKWLIA